MEEEMLLRLWRKLTGVRWLEGERSRRREKLKAWEREQSGACSPRRKAWWWEVPVVFPALERGYNLLRKESTWAVECSSWIWGDGAKGLCEGEVDWLANGFFESFCVDSVSNLGHFPRLTQWKRWGCRADSTALWGTRWGMWCTIASPLGFCFTPLCQHQCGVE